MVVKTNATDGIHKTVVIAGALINGLEASLGGVLGLLFKKHVSERLGDFLMVGQALAVVLVAVQGMVEGGSVVCVVLSMAIGGLVGYWLNIDSAVRRFGDAIQRKLQERFDGSSAFGDFSEGFVSATLFICIGAMAVVGSLEAGLRGDFSTLISKGLIDMVVCVTMASTLGVGVPFAGIVVFVYEALMSVAASALSPLLSDTVVTNLVVTGSLLLLAVGLNMLGVTKIKVANYLPAAFMPIALVPLLMLVHAI